MKYLPGKIMKSIWIEFFWQNHQIFFTMYRYEYSNAITFEQVIRHHSQRRGCKGDKHNPLLFLPVLNFIPR